MVSSTEIEAGVCPFIVHPSNPDLFLAVIELQNKEYTYKVAGTLGPGFETVKREEGEDHIGAINRFFREEILVLRGQVFIPDPLEAAKLCKVQLSPDTWVAVYPMRVSDDFVAGIGTEKHEIAGPLWLSRRRSLETTAGSGRVLFRTGTNEILECYRDRYDYSLQFPLREYSEPLKPFPPEVFDWIRKGATSTEALSLSGVDPRPLLDYLVLAHLRFEQKSV